MSLIQCKQLQLGYEGQVIASNIDFTVEAGNYLCIVGENGSGKSTLMKVILGLLRPMAGEVIFGAGLAQREIGYLPQQTLVQRDFPASVEEIVRSGFAASMKLRLSFTAAEQQRARENMARLGIESLRRRSYRELSGGQQQRVLLARALCATTKLLLLDEPTAGLDPGATEEMYSVIQSLNAEGITIIMISHDIKEITGRASHILHMGNEPLYFGKTAGYLDTAIWRG